MADPDPTYPFEIFFHILMAILFGTAVSLSVHVESGADMNPAISGQGGGSAQPAEVLTVIESVDALLMESFPVQITLHVTGYQPDGCTFPVMVDQSRDANSVTVRIYRELPPDILCTMQLVPYDENIKLEGGFEPGEYTIDVNGTVISVTV